MRPGSHLDRELKRVEELELGRLLARGCYGLRKVNSALAAPCVVPAHHRIKCTCKCSKG